jgi:hypothetical protein
MVARGIAQVDAAMVKTYAKNLWALLEEADFTERKAFLGSFIERIEVNKKRVATYYNLPYHKVCHQGNKWKFHLLRPLVELGLQ